MITLKQLASIYVLSFIEGGAAYDSFRNYNPFDIKRSAGGGIRIFMPAFGLLGIDFGYGFDPVLNGVGKNGWENILELDLDSNEKDLFTKSADAVRNMNVALNSI